MNKIAFCFLLYDTVNHKKIWEDFFSQDIHSTHSIYSHVKTVNKKTPDWIIKNQISTIKTEWCKENLVKAWVNMLKKAYKNPQNKYFTILSGECIPLFTYSQVYKKITKSKKSRVNIDHEIATYKETGLYYADQWTILNRKCAKLLINLYSIKRGHAWLRITRPRLCTKDNICYCPDEIFPINWFVYNLGVPSSRNYKKEIRDLPTTFTFWTFKHPHPVKFTYKMMIKMKKDICKSKAIFGRKFHKKAAQALALNCGK